MFSWVFKRHYSSSTSGAVPPTQTWILPSYGIISKTVYRKQPTERRRFSIDFTNQLIQGDTINTNIIPSISWELRGGGDGSALQLQRLTMDSQKLYFWIIGGIIANVYRIEAVIRTNNGKIIEGDALIKIEDK
jgi:hypothetical protein